jgi:hypothetical protein
MEDTTEDLKIAQALAQLSPGERVQANPDQDQRAESLEHIDFGDSAFNALLSKYKDHFKKAAEYGHFSFYESQGTELYFFNLPNGITLTYGQILALSGDFFAVADAPISVAINQDHSVSPITNMLDCKSRFSACYQTLAYAPKAVRQVDALISTFQAEADRVRNEFLSSDNTKTRAEISHERSMALNSQYAEIMQHRPSIGSLKSMLKRPLPAVLRSAYTDLLKTNYDHFAPYAKVAYRAGHELAMDMAKLAAKTPQENEKYRLLMLAVSLEAFAGHYSTDLFSSGHMRVPRAELPVYASKHPGAGLGEKQLISTFSGLASLGHVLVHEQHDEDGRLGLWVSNQVNPEPWQAFGDGDFFEEKSEPNRAMAIDMVKKGLEEVMAVFINQSHKATNFYQRYWPQVEDPKLGRNHYAMFATDTDAQGNAVLKKRADITQETGPDCKDYADEDGNYETWTAREALDERGINPLVEGVKFAFGH